MADPVTPADDSNEEVSFFKMLKRLVQKHDTDEAPDTVSGTRSAQENALGGKTREQKLMSVVDEAVTGAKGANPDY